MKAKVSVVKASGPQPPEPPPSLRAIPAERKVLHTPYSIRHRHRAGGGLVLDTVEKLMGKNLPTRVEHRPQGIFYIVVRASGGKLVFLFDEPSGRLIVSDRGM